MSAGGIGPGANRRAEADAKPRGVIDTAHGTRKDRGRIFRYAITTDHAKHDIATNLVGALAPRTTTHHADITDPVSGARRVVGDDVGR